MPVFFGACRHHSTKSAKWGAFDTVCHPCLQVGGEQLPLCSPAPPPMVTYDPVKRTLQALCNAVQLSWFQTLNNAILLFSVLFDMHSTTQYSRLLSQLSPVRTAIQILVVSLLSLVVAGLDWPLCHCAVA